MASYFIGMGGSVKYIPTSGSSQTPVSICVESWTVELRNDVQDVTTTCSGGFIDRIDGCTDATLTFTGFYDTSAPILAPIQPARTISFTATLGNGTSDISFEAVVSSVSIENPAKTVTKFTVTALSTGSISVTP